MIGADSGPLWGMGGGSAGARWRGMGRGSAGARLKGMSRGQCNGKVDGQGQCKVGVAQPPLPYQITTHMKVLSRNDENRIQ